MTTSQYSFAEEELQLAEETLTELLCLAISVRPALRLPITTLAESVADILPPDAVERSKEYARYRTLQSNKKE
jgi:hypothetical protein